MKMATADATLVIAVDIKSLMSQIIVEIVGTIIRNMRKLQMALILTVIYNINLRWRLTR